MKVTYQKLLTAALVVSLMLGFGLIAGNGLTRITDRPASVIPATNRPITSLKDLNQAFIEIAAQVKPAVVTVSTERLLRGRTPGPFASPFGNDPFFEYFFGPQQGSGPREREYRQQGLGSGVIVSSDGYILTNNHVIENVDSITVRTIDGERHQAKLVGADPKTDIAVIQIDARDLRYLELADSDSLQVGEIVLAVGSPMSENLAYTVTQGIVSATGRSNVGLADYEDFIQTDAAINPGNSGGPLVNLDGKLVGVNAAIASGTGGFQGIGFAVPSNMAKRVMQSLIAEGKVVRGWLGVSIQDVTDNIAHALGLDEPSGALIGDVVANSPAEKAGVESGDVVVALDGKPVDNSTHFRNKIAAAKPGTRVNLGLLRGEKRLDVTVVLGELPADQGALAAAPGAQERLGFSVATLTEQLARRYDISGRQTGAVVVDIDQSSAAFEAGLREGDLIQGVNRRGVDTEEEFYSAVGDTKTGDTVLLHVSRGGNGFYIAFELG